MQRSSSNTNHMKRGIRPSSILCRQSTQFSYLLCFFSFPRFVIFFLFAAWPPYGRCFNGHRRIMNGLCYTYPETKPDLLRWHRRNANGSYYARFLPQKLPKTVLLRTIFLTNLRVTHKIFFQNEQGPSMFCCATLIIVSHDFLLFFVVFVFVFLFLLLLSLRFFVFLL